MDSIRIIFILITVPIYVSVMPIQNKLDKRKISPKVHIYQSKVNLSLPLKKKKS